MERKSIQLKTKWKNCYSNKCHFVACTNKHVQPLRIEMKPLWSRLKGFEDVDHSIPWKQSAWSRRDRARKSNVLSKAVIVTIHLNNVSITCNQLFCILNEQNTGERLKASFNEEQDHSISLFV